MKLKLILIFLIMIIPASALTIQLNPGTTKFGIVIDSNDISKLYNGVTYWDDLVTPLTTGAKGLSNPPSLVLFKDGIYQYAFSNSIEAQKNDVYLSLQMSHAYKLGSQIECHLHFACGTASTNNVSWGLAWSTGDYGTNFTEATQKNISTTCGGNAYQAQLADFGFIFSFNKLSGIAVFKLTRESALASDTYTGNDAFGLSFDCHYQKDAPGSRLEYSK